MSIEFSAKLSALRREKSISQKDAAEALGVSQALLSHYEKGIRECSLDFVKKAADYYNVTSDYLLGLSETRHAFNELLADYDLAADSALNPKTILRCLLFLSGVAEKAGDASQIFFDDYFSLCIRKYLSVLQPNEKNIERMCDMILSVLTDERKKQDIKPTELTEKPLTVKTVEQHSNMLIAKNIAEIM